MEKLRQNDPENASWLRPLPENFADEGHYIKRKLILVGLSAVVLIGFGLMIWFSYTSENEEGGPIPVVRADNAVIKEKPDEPGGKEIPFQDREVFDRVDNLPKEAEDVLASSAEIPLKRPVAEEVAPPAEVEITETVEEAGQEVVAVTEPVARATKGNFMVQVGAFAERDKAETHWNTVKSENSGALSKLNPSYMRVDLGARGILYRVRGGMIESREAADEVCADLKKNNQSCMVVTN